MNRRTISLSVAVLVLVLVATEISALSDPLADASGSKLSVVPKSLTFKNGVLERKFSIRASGGSITGNVGSPGAPFSISDGAGSFSLSDGEAMSVDVRFSPAAKGTYRSKIAITSNAGKKPNQSVALIGKAKTAAPSPGDSGTPTPTSKATATRTPVPSRTASPARTRTPTPKATSTAVAGNWRVLAWNDLGMHCMDSDYSIFSILPPFNVLHAQLIDGNGHLVKNATTADLTYEGVADPSGSINTTSAGKTNFWDFAVAFFGSPIPVDIGVAGYDMPGLANVPQPMKFSASRNTFEAVGIPITPLDNSSARNFYPMMKVVARDASGRVGATANVVPVSDEMDCRACHASGSAPAAMPNGGWVNNPDPEKDYRLNILLFHDQHVPDTGVYQKALDQAGYPNGQYNSALAGKPVLCASCHLSNALAPFGIVGIAGIPQLTTSVHGMHAKVIDPLTGLPLDATANRTACYRCHPGSTTQCLRGAMGAARDSKGNMLMQCQSCHGLMTAVGGTRPGWLDEPSCQNCHSGDAVTNNGQIRYLSVIDPATGKRRIPRGDLFATNADVPIKGSNLYRFSLGHGDLQCEACHGSTHAEYPSLERNDNLQSIALQGHVGMLADCQACHLTSPGLTGGPHGMHFIGQQWVSGHPDYVDKNGSASCQACHGGDYKGTVLSRAQGNRSFTTGDAGSVTFKRGDTISCYSCHAGPNPGKPSAARSQASR